MSAFDRLLRSGRLLPGKLWEKGVASGAPTHPFLQLVARWLRRPLLPAVRLWRRNIQLRVVITTLLMSLAVVLLLGLVVIGQVRNGLLEAKRQAARSQAAGGFAVAQQMADGAEGADSTDNAPGSRVTPNPGTWRTNLVEQLASGGQGAYSVVVLSSTGGGVPFGTDGAGTLGPRSYGDVRPEESIPAELRTAVERESGSHEQYARLVRLDGGTEPALVVGKRLNDASGNPYQLYYLFPFTQEEKSLALVTGTLATAGVFVVVLLGAIAWLVVRQVVTPVRMAAGISERLAAGRLQERMKVTGEDDIARLGESFNKMAQKLQLKIQQLEELSRMQRRFVSDVSHELRTPITTVRMAADVIHAAREEFDPVTARSAELLLSQLDRFESLLADLLEISRFDAGAAALEAESTDLRDVVTRVVEGAEPLAERKGSRLLVRGDEQPVIAEADPRRIERVLRNLVVNAIEYGEGRGVVIRLASSPPGPDGSPGAVAVAVRDYGVGLRPEEAERVFNRFWRADPARARTTGGTGLGLAIAVEDARLHGGWLQAWGEPGGGSQFRLTLPRNVGEVLCGSPIPLEPADSRRRRARAAQRSAGAARRDAARSGDAAHRASTVPADASATGGRSRDGSRQSGSRAPGEQAGASTSPGAPSPAAGSGGGPAAGDGHGGPGPSHSGPTTGAPRGERSAASGAAVPSGTEGEGGEDDRAR